MNLKLGLKIIMKYENYELVIANIMPCFWYEEGDEQEQYYVDELTCDCRKFYDNKEFN